MARCRGSSGSLGDLLRRFYPPGTGDVPGDACGRSRLVYSRIGAPITQMGRIAWGSGGSDHARLGALPCGARTNLATAPVAMAASPAVPAGIVARVSEVTNKGSSPVPPSKPGAIPMAAGSHT